ncbi:MAG: MMPL family transporter, partial [Pseudomonadales bacterium]|nr:MMPL family transporter [Pseudomonadales bacterium]
MSGTHTPTRLEGALGACAGACERHARTVLIAIALLTLAAGVASALFMRIDSDLSKLIRPSDELRWYRDDQAYNAAFPHLLQTAVVVISGPRYAPVVAHAERLRDAFAADPAFSHVFAPSIDPFLADRRLYFLAPEQLVDWGSGVEQDYGVLLRLADSAGLANGALTFADQVSARPGMPLPRPLATLAASFEQPPPRTIELHGYPHLEPEVDGVHHELIVLKGEQRLDASLPNAELVAHIERTIAARAAPPGVSVRLTGEVKLADEEIGAALEGIGLAGTLSVFLLALVLGVGVRSARIVAATFVLLGSGILLTLGWAVLAVGSFNTLALIFVVMFFGLGVDFVVHYALRLRESVSEPDGDGGAASAAVIAAR